jgi:hypothetical protein
MSLSPSSFSSSSESSLDNSFGDQLPSVNASPPLAPLDGLQTEEDDNLLHSIDSILEQSLLEILGGDVSQVQTERQSPATQCNPIVPVDNKEFNVLFNEVPFASGVDVSSSLPPGEVSLEELQLFPDLF